MNRMVFSTSAMQSLFPTNSLVQYVTKVSETVEGYLKRGCYYFCQSGMFM